jgi:hypothetical protein
MKKNRTPFVIYAALPLYRNCLKYRFGFISIFSFGLASVTIQHNIQNPSEKKF